MDNNKHYKQRKNKSKKFTQLNFVSRFPPILQNNSITKLQQRSIHLNKQKSTVFRRSLKNQILENIHYPKLNIPPEGISQKKIIIEPRYYSNSREGLDKKTSNESLKKLTNKNNRSVIQKYFQRSFDFSENKKQAKQLTRPASKQIIIRRSLLSMDSKEINSYQDLNQQYRYMRSKNIKDEGQQRQYLSTNKNQMISKKESRKKISNIKNNKQKISDKNDQEEELLIIKKLMNTDQIIQQNNIQYNNLSAFEPAGKVLILKKDRKLKLNK